MKMNIKDLIGRTYGKLTILKEIDDYVSLREKRKRKRVECVCVCGNYKTVLVQNLKNGSVTTCGCNRSIPFKYLKGHKFGRLTIINEVTTFIERNGRKRRRVLCECDCGNEISVLLQSLKSGSTISCGCYNNEIRILNATTHGKCKTTTYHSWKHMLNRCTNPNYSKFYNYGGRGITVCNEWLIFENFYQDMGDRPPGTSIDRINNEKGYYKDNCRWSTKKEQANNMRVCKNYKLVQLEFKTVLAKNINTDEIVIHNSVMDLALYLKLSANTIWNILNTKIRKDEIYEEYRFRYFTDRKDFLIFK